VNEQAVWSTEGPAGLPVKAAGLVFIVGHCCPEALSSLQLQAAMASVLESRLVHQNFNLSGLNDGV
jgi:hypothetical protein